MIAEWINWWSEGLATALLSVEKGLHPPRRFRLNMRARPATLQPVGGSKDGAETAVLLPAGSPSTPLPDEILQKTRGSIIEISVPAAAILERKLDPLPGESLPYIDNVVRHQIESIFPWSADDALYAISTHNREDSKIDITIRATPRAPISPALALADACGASEAVVVSDDDRASSEKTTYIPAAIGADSQNRVQNNKLLARYAAIGLLFLSAFIVGWTSFTYWSLSDDVATLDQAIADRVAFNKRGADLNSGAKRDDLESKKQRAVPVVMLLDTLSSVLPDDTYLTDMSFEAGRLRISGISARVADLVPLLENSGHFKNASFYAPTTRIPGRPGDRFSIEASVAP